MPEQAAGRGPAARQAPIDGVRHVVAVTSAKGGVGKSTVAVNLAAALRTLGLKVGFADVDIYGPSAPVMLGTTELPHPDEESRMIHPIDAHGLKVMSMGFFLDDNAPVIWRGPMVMSATRQFLRGVAWGELDVLVVDLPPGTGDIPLTLAQEVPIDGGVVVTTPQDVALADVTRGVAMLGKVNAPVLGVVDNMSLYACPQCGHEDRLFGERRGEDIAAALGVPLLAEVPLVEPLRASGDAGCPLVLSDPSHPAARTFIDLAVAVRDRLGAEAGDLHGPEPTEIVNDTDAGRVRITWSDGSETNYSISGLRGWCPCAQCQGHSAQVRFIAAPDVALSGFEGVGRYAVRFLWADGHDTGMYSYAWLREIADFDECRA